MIFTFNRKYSSILRITKIYNALNVAYTYYQLSNNNHLFQLRPSVLPTSHSITRSLILLELELKSS